MAIGASDAGIYVGQSNNIIVRRNRAERNVAGIEIENSINADVYENIATRQHRRHPRLQHAQPAAAAATARACSATRSSTTTPTTSPRKGAAVASVPAGSGVVINSNDKVEIFDNDIADNETANVIISSYWSTGYMNKYGVAKDYDPYPEEIHVHGNRFKGGGDSPDGLDLKALKVAMFGLSGRLPDVLWDGYVNSASARSGPQICVDSGVAASLNADGPNKYKNPQPGDAMQCAAPCRVACRS